MVLLDSNHTHNHVYEELKVYAKLVSKKSYCVVFDTIIDDLPETYGKNRPWGKNDNPKSALKKYLKLLKNNQFDLNNKKLSFKNDKFNPKSVTYNCCARWFFKKIMIKTLVVPVIPNSPLKKIKELLMEKFY